MSQGSPARAVQNRCRPHPRPRPPDRLGHAQPAGAARPADALHGQDPACLGFRRTGPAADMGAGAQRALARAAEWADLLADGIGIALGCLPGLIRARA